MYATNHLGTAVNTSRKTDPSSIQKIALLAGNGILPHSLTAAFQKNKTPYHIIAFQGLTESSIVEAHPHTYVGIGEVGRILDVLKAENVTHIIMAGALRRPSFSEIKVDALGAKWLARLGLSMFSGDDGLLKKLIQLLEEEGFSVMSPHEVLQNLVIETGVHTTKSPDPEAFQDIARGLSVLKALDHHDVGQAVIVQQGLVLGIEAIEGTAGLLKRTAEYKREGFGGVLVKTAKSSQTHKADLPTIGLDTVKQIKQAGLAGMAVSADTTQILQKELVIEALNNAGLFLIALSPGEIIKLTETYE